jgi:hypothetical protein
MVEICAHLLAAPQWTLNDAELDAGTELEVTHGRQADRSQPRREARDTVAHNAARGTSEGARCEARDTGHAARGRRVIPIQKGWTP